MLNGVVLVIHSCSHSAHIASHAVAQKLLQTVLIDNFRIIVQKQDIFTLCKSGSVIIDSRIVKLSVPVNHMSLWILCLQLFIILEGFLLRTVVFHNNILVILICGFFVNGIHAPLQICNMILIGNNNGDQRIMVPDKPCAVKTQKLSLKHLCVDPGSLIMLFNSPFSCLKSIGLAFRILCCGILMAAPVIKDLGNMINLFRLYIFHTAENKIIILSPVKLLTKHSNLTDDLSVHHKKMADVVYRTQKIRIVIRLKMRLEKLVAIHGHFILIGIKNTDVPVFI